jgi:hypothetical protein
MNLSEVLAAIIAGTSPRSIIEQGQNVPPSTAPQQASPPPEPEPPVDPTQVGQAQKQKAKTQTPRQFVPKQHPQGTPTIKSTIATGDSGA